MRKIVHLYKRSPRLEIAAFHAALADEAEHDPDIPGLARYVQSHTLLGGYRKGELPFDALDEFSFEHPALASYYFGSPDHRQLLARRAGVLDAAATISLQVDVVRIKSRPVPSGALKSIELVTRRPLMSLAEFRHYWRCVHGPIASTIAPLLRYEQNPAALCHYEEGATPPLDGLAITWFASIDSMRAGAATPEYERTRADERNFLPDGHLPTIITREVLER